MRFKEDSGANSFYVPKEERDDVLFLAHDAPSGGHFGVDKTLNKIIGSAWWPTRRKDVENHCRTCARCQRGKHKPVIGAEVQPLQVTAPYQQVHVDLVGPYPTTARGNKYVLTLCDASTKHVSFYPIQNKQAVTVAKQMSDHVKLYGMPDRIVTDQGTEFKNQLMDSLCNMLGIARRTTSPYHPESNAQIERQHRTLGNYLRTITSPNQTDWDMLLKDAAFAINISKHSGTGYTPFELMFGRKPRTPVGVMIGADTLNEEFTQFQNNWKNILKQAAINDGLARKVPQEKQVDNPDINIGDLVLVKFYAARKGKSRKLKELQQGPYKIISIRDGTTVKLQSCSFPLDIIERHLKHCVKYHAQKDGAITDDGEFEVESILDHKGRKNNRQYLVKWKGYAEEHNSWVHEQDLRAPIAMQEYEQVSKLKATGMRRSRRNLVQFEVDRIVESKQLDGKVFYLTAENPDVGPDEYKWLQEKEIENPDVIQRFNDLKIESGGVLD